MIKVLYAFLIFQLLLLAGGCTTAPKNNPKALPGHSHNDYNHSRPLYFALENGLRSVEADVFSQGDSLYVAHDEEDITPGKTLRSLYLDPLAERLRTENAYLFDDSTDLILLIDIKDKGLESYSKLHLILNEYEDFLSYSLNDTLYPRAVSIVISGNRPFDFMHNQVKRFAGVDGRVPDLDKNYSTSFMPLISDNWNTLFSWDGEGEMPLEEKSALDSMVAKAHRQGRMIRFWAVPEPAGRKEVVWKELYRAGVDLINTDYPEELGNFLIHQ